MGFKTPAASTSPPEPPQESPAPTWDELARLRWGDAGADDPNFVVVDGAAGPVTLVYQGARRDALGTVHVWQDPDGPPALFQAIDRAVCSTVHRRSVEELTRSNPTAPEKSRRSA